LGVSCRYDTKQSVGKMRDVGKVGSKGIFYWFFRPVAAQA